MHMIGRIIEYDGATGMIITPNMSNPYLFLKKDLESEVNVGDIVNFNGEVVHNTLRAYFVKRSEYQNNIEVKIKTKK